MSSDPMRETAAVWSRTDAAALRLMAGVGCDVASMARALHRSESEIERRMRSEERTRENG